MRLELDKRGIDLPSTLCPCCNDEVESLDHCLISCKIANNVWDKIIEWWKLDIFNIGNLNEILRNMGGALSSNSNKDLWRVVVWTTCYYMWKNANERAFLTNITSAEKIVQEIRSKTFDWNSRKSMKGVLLWDCWVMRPNECGI